MNIMHLSVRRKRRRVMERRRDATSIEMQLDEFATKFEKDYSLVSCLSTNNTMRSAWFLDSGASRHMPEAQ
jgi:transposase-like protein